MHLLTDVYLKAGHFTQFFSYNLLSDHWCERTASSGCAFAFDVVDPDDRFEQSLSMTVAANPLSNEF